MVTPLDPETPDLAGKLQPFPSNPNENGFGVYTFGMMIKSQINGEALDFFFFFAVLGLELKTYTLSHSTRPFFNGCFRDRISQTIYPGWL
jgi:hypothetical protein